MRELTKSEVRDVGGGDINAWLTSCGKVGASTWGAVIAANAKNIPGAWVGIIQASTGIYQCVKDSSGVIQEVADAQGAVSCRDQGNGYSVCTYESSGGPVYISVPNETPTTGQTDTTPTSFESQNLSGDLNSDGSINLSHWDSDVCRMQYDSAYSSDYNEYNF